MSTNTEISAEAWQSLTAPDSQIVGRLVLGVGVGHGGVSSSIVVAGFTAAGAVQLETIERAEGTWWVEKMLREKVAQHNPVVIAWDNGGPTRMIAPEIHRSATAATPPTELQPLTGVEWQAACAAFKQRVSEGRVAHVGDLHIADAIASGERQDTGDGWRWNVKGARGDITPVLAATAALRALESLPEPPQEFTGNYFVDLDDWEDD